MNRFLQAEWMDYRRGPLWWPVKALYYLGWVVAMGVISGAVGLALWAIGSLLGGHF